MSIACCPCYLPHRARLNHPSGVGWFSLRVWRVEILKNHNSCGLKKVWPVGFHLWLECFHKVTLYLGKPLDHSHHLPLDFCSQHAPQSGVRCIEREREFLIQQCGLNPFDEWLSKDSESVPHQACPAVWPLIQGDPIWHSLFYNNLDAGESGMSNCGTFPDDVFCSKRFPV